LQRQEAGRPIRESVTHYTSQLKRDHEIRNERVFAGPAFSPAAMIIHNWRTNCRVKRLVFTFGEASGSPWSLQKYRAESYCGLVDRIVLNLVRLINLLQHNWCITHADLWQ